MKKIICKCGHNKIKHVLVDETKRTFCERTICETCWLDVDRPTMKLCLGYEAGK